MTLRIRDLGGTEEGFDGLESSQESRIWRLFDDATPHVEPTIAAMKALVLATAPVSVGSKTRDRISREYDEDGRSWLWTVDYNFQIPESSLTWGFDTQGGSIRITHALDQTGYVASGSAPEMNNGIGYSGEEFQGVDKVIPALKLNARYRWPADAVTTSYINTLASLSGTINQSSWQGYDPGELLFLGAAGDVIPGKPTEISYQFAASANASGLSIGSITGIDKKGHEYLWILYEDDEDAVAKTLTKQPLAAYVARLYTESAFSTFGIGA